MLVKFKLFESKDLGLKVVMIYKYYNNEPTDELLSGLLLRVYWTSFESKTKGIIYPISSVKI